MHQIRFLLGLCPRPCWRAHSTPIDSAVFEGPTSKERGTGGRMWMGIGGERGGKELAMPVAYAKLNLGLLWIRLLFP